MYAHVVSHNSELTPDLEIKTRIREKTNLPGHFSGTDTEARRTALYPGFEPLQLASKCAC